MYISKTDSTNRLMREYLPQEDGFFISTDYQTAGRGQEGNHWESEAGKNILASLLIRPKDLDANKQFRLSMMVSLSVVEALSSTLLPYSPTPLLPLAIKWPNDIYYKDKKLGGILIENILRSGKVSDCIFGLGLNVNQERFVSDAPNPISLFQITGKTFDKEALLTQIRTRVDDYKHWLSDDRYNDLKQNYLQFLYHRDGIHEYEDAEGRFKAVFKNIDEVGRLLLEDETGKERTYLFKQIKYII